MRHAVLVAIAIAGCGFQAKSGGSSDGPPDSPSTVVDAAGIDAMIDGALDAPTDAPPDAPPVWTTVDTITVPCIGTTVMSTFVLQNAVMYKLLASGECIANTTNGSKADAEYVGYNINQTLDVVSGVDAGIAVNDTTPGSTKNPRWGNLSPQHMYEVMWPGVGAVITIRLHASDYSNNSGSLTLQIQALQ